MSNIIEIPRYQSHKQVQALKIKLAIMNPRGVELHFENERFCPIQMPLEFARKHTDGQGVQALAGGYVVWYKDGYTSWSPAEAFEGGYTLIQQHVADLPILSEEGYRQLAELLKNPPEFNERLKAAIEKSRSGKITIKPRCTDERPCVNCFSGQGECEVKQESDDLTQFLEQTDFDAAEQVASEKADAQPLPTGGEDDCEGCKI